MVDGNLGQVVTIQNNEFMCVDIRSVGDDTSTSSSSDELFLVEYSEIEVSRREDGESPDFDLEALPQELVRWVRSIGKANLGQAKSVARKYLEQLAKLIADENGILSNRVTWMLSFQAFMIVALGFMVKDAAIEKWNFLIYLLGGLGTISSFSFYHTISRSTKAVGDRFQEAAFLNATVLKDEPPTPVIGRRSPAAKWASLSKGKQKSIPYSRVSRLKRASYWVKHFSAAWRLVPMSLTLFWILLVILYHFRAFLK